MLAFIATVALPAAATAPPRFRLSTIDGHAFVADAIRIDKDRRLTLEGLRADDPAASQPAETALASLDDLSQIIVAANLRAAPPPASSPATRETIPTLQFYSAAGGRFRGTVHTGTGDVVGIAGHVVIDAGFARPLEWPLTALAAIRFTDGGSDAAARDLAARLAQRDKTRDTLIVDAPDGLATFTGSLEQLSASGWAMRTGERTLRGDYTRAYAVVLAAGLGEAPVVDAVVRTLEGSEWLGRLASADESAVTFAPAGAPQMQIDWNAIRVINIRSARVRYLSDLDPATTSGTGFFGAAWPTQRDRAVTGGVLRIHGQFFARGLGVHSRSELTYVVPKEFSRFAASIGIDDAAASRGEVIFRVLLADKVAFESPPIRGGQPAVEVNVGLEGAGRVTLVVDYAGGLDVGDHADWGNARFLKD